jgi:hypothetical protein
MYRIQRGINLQSVRRALLVTRVCFKFYVGGYSRQYVIVESRSLSFVRDA